MSDTPEDDTVVLENISKKKRGRPTIVHPDWKALWEGNFRSQRSTRNRLHACHAANALRSDFPFLYAEGVFQKWTILTELGRFDDEDTIRMIAKVIAENQMTTAKALEYLSFLKKMVAKGCRLIEDTEDGDTDND